MTPPSVVFAPNWLGDAVMALPAVADFCRSRAGRPVHVAARASVAPIVSLFPGIERTVVLGDRASSIASLRSAGYGEALLLTNSFNTAWIARRAGIPERYGYRNEGRGVLLTRAVVPPTRVHQVEYYQHLTSALGCARGDATPRLAVPDELRRRGEALLVEHGWDGKAPLVAVAPGAAFGTAKQWPTARYAAAIDALAREGVGAVLIGARADVPASRQVQQLATATLAPIDLVGTTDLPMLTAVLLQTRALITNDSGAMHVAAALGVNVTAVFGPTNEHETRPRGTGRLSVVHAETWCRPCMLTCT